ncbi:hypothetical protein ADICEAN_04055 [Cesiribacter andamanensis AMV16]|uniref:Uncharacterized protein n=1 Tax=Cesiribacter andamanensis AMV16 TaxID=1279009 RepID=M7MWN9_9BACT|nr:hypothetical protein ADICEAN_04055 [Cesiribacter andamanensis AMV16]
MFFTDHKRFSGEAGNVTMQFGLCNAGIEKEDAEITPLILRKSAENPKALPLPPP